MRRPENPDGAVDNKYPKKNRRSRFGISFSAPVILYAPDAPVELQRIVSKARCKDKENRYQTTEELLDDLRDLKRELDLKGERRGPSAAGSGEKTVRMDRQEATVVITDAAESREDHFAKALINRFTSKATSIA